MKSLHSINVIVLALIYLFSRYGIVLGMLHFIWTFSEFHAILISLMLLTMEISNTALMKIYERKDKNE